MAKAKYRKKKESRDKKRKWNLFIIFMISASMLLSGFMYLGSQEGGAPKKEILGIHVETYNMEEFSGGIILKVTEVIPEVVVVPRNKCISYYTINSISNISVAGVEVKPPEVSNPSVYPEGRYMCGDWIILRFGVGDGGNATLDELRGELDGILSDHSLHGSYVSRLLQNTTGLGSIQVVGSADIVEGDYVTASLFRKIKNNTIEAMIGFEEEKVQAGPNISAEIVNLTGITVNGEISSDININDVRDRLDTDKINLNPPRIILNETLNNETLNRLRDLAGVEIDVIKNTTTISFNASLRNISQVLNGRNLTYSLQKGGISFSVPLSSNITFIGDILSGNNVGDIEFKKTGHISITPWIIVDDRVVMIENNDRFNAVLYMDSGVGDSINVSVSTIKFGDSIIALQAFQID